MAGHLGHADTVPLRERKARAVSFQSLYKVGNWKLAFGANRFNPAEKSIEAIESFHEINEIHPSHRIESGPSQPESPPRLARLRLGQATRP